MPKTHEKYPIYHALLYLYPKHHRQIYGEQMVQTLDDILADQSTQSERLAVWLKVCLELPINIIEENIQSMGEISVNRLSKITGKQLLQTLVAVLLVGSYVLLGVMWFTQYNQNKVLGERIDNAQHNQLAISDGDYNAVSIVPSEGAIYMPLANLKLPATTLNEGLVYAYTPDHKVPGLQKTFPATLDISTHNLSVSDFSGTNQFDCSQVVYADFVTPSYPVNPMWKSDGSFKLADGRTMNVYYAQSILGCASSWSLNDVNSKSIADSLKQATSY